MHGLASTIKQLRAHSVTHGGGQGAGHVKGGQVEDETVCSFDLMLEPC